MGNIAHITCWYDHGWYRFTWREFGVITHNASFRTISAGLHFILGISAEGRVA